MTYTICIVVAVGIYAIAFKTYLSKEGLKGMRERNLALDAAISRRPFITAALLLLLAPIDVLSILAGPFILLPPALLREVRAKIKKKRNEIRRLRMQQPVSRLNEYAIVLSYIAGFVDGYTRAFLKTYVQEISFRQKG